MNRIKELRKQKGMTAKELADMLGISQSMLTNYENGSSTPREYTIWKKLSELFNVSVSYLMGLTDIMGMANDTSISMDFAMIDTEQIKADYIDTGKPIEFQISSLEEYAVLANISQLMLLGGEDVKTLLTTLQSLIREKYSGRCTEFRLPDKTDK